MELKTPIGRKGKLQKFYIAILKSFGFNAQFVESYDEAVRILAAARLPEEGHADDAGTVSGWPVFRPRSRQD